MPKHWNCFVAGCTSNYTTKISGLKYYRIPKRSVKEYDAFFKTDGVKWDSAFICSRHWSKGRENSKHLPDVRIPDNISGAELRRKSPYNRSAERSKAVRSLNKQLNTLKHEKRDVSADKIFLRNQISELQEEVENLKHRNNSLEEMNENLTREKNALKSEVADLRTEQDRLETVLNQMKEEMRNKSFDWATITESKFKYLCGLEKENFVTIFRCFQPFLNVMRYEGCTSSTDFRRKWSKENELFACLIICRHALHLGVMAWILNISESTMSRIFLAWMTFGHAVFSKLDLAHPKCLVEKMMPTAYKNLDFSHIVLVIDATEFKITGFTDLQLNALFFSDYKSSHTVKALPCLTPHGSAAKIPEVYPGSITDTVLTEMVGALDNVLCHDGVLTDKGKYF